MKPTSVTNICSCCDPCFSRLESVINMLHVILTYYHADDTLLPNREKPLLSLRLMSHAGCLTHLRSGIRDWWPESLQTKPASFVGQTVWNCDKSETSKAHLTWALPAESHLSGNEKTVQMHAGKADTLDECTSVDETVTRSTAFHNWPCITQNLRKNHKCS